MGKSPVYSYSALSDDTRNLNTDKFRVLTVINREDGEPLTLADQREIDRDWVKPGSPEAVEEAVYAYSVPVEDTRGLDPEVFNVTTVIERDDGEPLTRSQVRSIEKKWKHRK